MISLILSGNIQGVFADILDYLYSHLRLFVIICAPASLLPLCYVAACQRLTAPWEQSWGLQGIWDLLIVQQSSCTTLWLLNRLEVYDMVVLKQFLTNTGEQLTL